MLVPDSTVWIDYFNDVDNAHTLWLDCEVDRLVIGVPDLVLCEVLQGFTDEKQFRQVHREMSMFEVLSTGGEEMAVAAASNYWLLRRIGVTVRKTIDCLLATLCLMEGHSLLHRDRDFDPFEKHLGLKVIHLWREFSSRWRGDRLR